MNQKQVKVAIVGLGFGAEFIPIYQKHPGTPDVRHLPAQRRTAPEDRRRPSASQQRFTRFEDVLADPNVDFVHINSPIPDHAWMSIAALKAGKHVHVHGADGHDHRGVPRRSSTWSRQTGLKYMMAETVVYSREFLFLKEMYQKGELGKIQYLAASHPQDMDGWPEYWERMIPMHYATHVVSPCLGLVNGRAEYVSCFGSGTVRDDIRKKSGNRFAVESCHIKIKDSDVAAHIWRFLYDTARQYRESFDVYGTKKSFEWTLVEGEPHILHTAKKPEPEIPSPVEVPDFAHLLPEPIRHVHAFDPGRRAPVVHPRSRARWLAPAPGERIRHGAAAETAILGPTPSSRPIGPASGICAHESALAGGQIVRLPEFTLA